MIHSTSCAPWYTMHHFVSNVMITWGGAGGYDLLPNSVTLDRLCHHQHTQVVDPVMLQSIVHLCLVFQIHPGLT